MEAFLDTNFIIYCVAQKIDFIEQLKGLGFVPVVPREVIDELKDLQEGKKISRADKEAIKLALQIFSSTRIKKAKLGGQLVDDALIVKGQQGMYIASLDNGIRKRVPNNIVIETDKKQLAVERK